MEGEINKWTNLMSGWQKRILILKGEILYYYEKKGESAKGRVHLLVSQITECQDDELKFEVNTGSTIFYFKTETKEEKANWIQALKQAKLNADRSLIKTDPNKDFSFNSAETGDLPLKLQELYTNVESIFNINIKLEKQLKSLESDGSKFDNNLIILQSLVKQQNDPLSKTIKLMKTLIVFFKDLFCSVSNFGKLFGIREGNNFGGGEIETKNYKEDNLNNEPSMVRSGVNKNMLFGNSKAKISEDGKSLIFFIQSLINAN